MITILKATLATIWAGLTLILLQCPCQLLGCFGIDLHGPALPGSASFLEPEKLASVYACHLDEETVDTMPDLLAIEESVSRDGSTGTLGAVPLHEEGWKRFAPCPPARAPPPARWGHPIADASTGTFCVYQI